MNSPGAIADRTIIYVTRDIERAMGMKPGPNYRIVANKTPYAETIKAQFPEYVTLVQSPTGDILDTAELLQTEAVRTLFSSLISHTPSLLPYLLVFKNTLQIETIAAQEKWPLLNPPAELAEKIENKVSQVAWLGDLALKYLPVTEVKEAKEATWQKKPFILQWAHSHTGDGTILINSESELISIQTKFPDRIARVTDYVRGPSFTVNVSVTADTVLMGNISYQITGLPPFTDNPFSTIGNDWSATHSFLDEGEIALTEEMSGLIGLRIQSDGWRGLFGIDFIRDDERGGLKLIEINARQPASASFESQLQEGFRAHGIPGVTMFEAHVLSLIGQVVSGPLVPINDGAQILQRITKARKSVSDATIKSLNERDYSTISYENSEPNTDLLRIQSTLGIMESHDKFNKRGKEIEEILAGAKQK